MKKERKKGRKEGRKEEKTASMAIHRLQLREERTSRIVSTLPVNNVPSECGQRSGGRGERKVTVHFFHSLLPLPPRIPQCVISFAFIHRTWLLAAASAQYRQITFRECVRDLLSMRPIG